MGKCFRNIKREISLFLLSFRYFIHVAIGARPLTTFYRRMSDIILRCEWTVVITCRSVKSLSALWSHDTSWIIIDRSTLIQYHVYFFLSNGLEGGGSRRPMHPMMKSTRVGPIIFYYILDRVVLVHRSGVITSTCFKNRLHLNI